MKWRHLVLVLSCAAAPFLPARAQVQLLNGVAAVVNDQVITFDDVRGSSRRALEMMALTTRPDSPQFAERAAAIQKDALEQLIERELILHEYTSKGFNIPESIIEDTIQKQIQRDFRDRVTLTKTLRARGQTLESWRRDQRDQFIIAQMFFFNVNQNVVVSPKKIERYYQDHEEKYRLGESAKVRMILIDEARHARGESAKLAEAALTRIKAGEDFAKVADEVSDDARRFKGGDRGWVENKDADLRRELREFVFSSPAGSVSDVIALPGAVFIVKVEERKPAGVKPLNEVRQEIEEVLKSQEFERLRRQWIEKLRAKAFVQYF